MNIGAIRQDAEDGRVQLSYFNQELITYDLTRTRCNSSTHARAFTHRHTHKHARHRARARTQLQDAAHPDPPAAGRRRDRHPAHRHGRPQAQLRAVPAGERGGRNGRGRHAAVTRPSRGAGRRVPPGAAAHHVVLQNSRPGDVAAQDCLDKLHHLLPQLAARRYAQLMALVNEANVRLTSSHADVEQFVDYLKFLVIRTPALAAPRRAAPPGLRAVQCRACAVPVRIARGLRARRRGTAPHVAPLWCLCKPRDGATERHLASILEHLEPQRDSGLGRGRSGRPLGGVAGTPAGHARSARRLIRRAAADVRTQTRARAPARARAAASPTT